MRRQFERLIAAELGLIFDDDDPVWTDAREVIVIGGWRSGKSTRGAFRAFCKALNPATKLIWLVGPDYQQATEEFRYIMEWGYQLGVIDVTEPISMPAEGSRSLRLITGCRVETRSSQHAERLASVPPDMIVLCEPGQMSSEVYDMAAGRLVEKRGDLWMVGTLESDDKPVWQWYENMALDWLQHDTKSREQAFCVPTWSNRAVFPMGLLDPELLYRKEHTPEYKWNRRYGGLPEGIERPVYPLMWETGSLQEYMIEPDEDTYWTGGAIGVDYGRSWEHPSAAVVIAEDNHGRYWVRDAWKGVKVNLTEIQSVVDAMKHNHGIHEVCTDPIQDVLADALDGVSASKGANTTEMRFSLTNGLLDTGRLYFDLNAPLIREVWASMRMLRRIPRGRGDLKYERPLDDDLAQCVNYAVELLVAGDSYGDTVPLDAGSARMRYSPGSTNEGSI